jgi:hypothetical protein
VDWGGATTSGDRIYVHVLDAPVDGELVIPIQSDANITIRNSKSEAVTFDRTTEGVIIYVASAGSDAPDAVFTIEPAA